MNPVSGVPVGVDYMLAAAAILGAIAWPIVVLVLLLSFRSPIRNALQGLIEFRFGSATLKFDRASGEVALSVVESVAQARSDADDDKGDALTRLTLRDLYETLAQQQPAVAILKGYVAVEQWLADNLPAHGVAVRSDNRARSAVQMTRDAVAAGVLPRSALQQLEGLAVMRNLVAHRGDVEKVTVENAHEFLTLADAVIFSFDYALSRAPQPSE